MPNAMVIDLSHHNAVADFARVRAAGVIHKATQGIGFVDKMYIPRKQPALDAGLLWGAYHFGTADDVDDQVEHFIDTVQPDGSFALVLDFEKNEPEPGNSMSLDQAKAFLTSVEARTGQRPRLYTSGAYMTATAGAAGDPDTLPNTVCGGRNTPTLRSCTPPGPTSGFGNSATAFTDLTSIPSTASVIATVIPSTETRTNCVRAGSQLRPLPLLVRRGDGGADAGRAGCRRAARRGRR